MCTNRPCSRASWAVAARSASSTVYGACGASEVVMRPSAVSRCRRAKSSDCSRPSAPWEEKKACPRLARIPLSAVTAATVSIEK